MADRGIGTRQEKAEEVRQNDRGKIMQTQTLLLLSFCRDSSEEQEASEGEARRTQPHPAAFGFLLTRVISSAASCPILICGICGICGRSSASWRPWRPRRFTLCSFLSLLRGLSGLCGEKCSVVVLMGFSRPGGAEEESITITRKKDRAYLRSKKGFFPVALRGMANAIWISGGTRPISMAALPKVKRTRLSAWWAAATAAAEPMAMPRSPAL